MIIFVSSVYSHYHPYDTVYRVRIILGFFLSVSLFNRLFICRRSRWFILYEFVIVINILFFVNSWMLVYYEMVLYPNITIFY